MGVGKLEQLIEKHYKACSGSLRLSMHDTDTVF